VEGGPRDCETEASRDRRAPDRNRERWDGVLSGVAGEIVALPFYFSWDVALAECTIAAG
jgi:hypothetical protein